MIFPVYSQANANVMQDGNVLSSVRTHHQHIDTILIRQPRKLATIHELYYSHHPFWIRDCPRRQSCPDFIWSSSSLLLFVRSHVSPFTSPILFISFSTCFFHVYFGLPLLPRTSNFKDFTITFSSSFLKT